MGCDGLSYRRRFLCRGIFLEISGLATYLCHFSWLKKLLFFFFAKQEWVLSDKTQMLGSSRGVAARRMRLVSWRF